MMMARREPQILPHHHHRGDVRHGACFPALLESAVVAGMTVGVGLAFRPGNPGDSVETAYAALIYLNYLLMLLAAGYFRLTTPGSAAQRRARLATWALCTSLVVLIDWNVAAQLAMPFKILPWVMSAASLGPPLHRFYLNHVRGQ